MRQSRTLSVAPMMDVTDVCWRALARCMSRHTSVFSEMVVSNAVVEHNCQSLPVKGYEHPVAIQLGGSDPTSLAKAAAECDDGGVDEVNLNCGCPSPRVSQANDQASTSARDRCCFGASLIKEPELVGEILRKMNEATDCEVTCKTRIGASDACCTHYDYNELLDFVSTVSSESDVSVFDLHARIAVLNGLSPARNRNASQVPLRHQEVHRLKKDFPSLFITINGGIDSYEGVKYHLQHVDGVMVGRWPMNNPYCLAYADAEVFGDNYSTIPSREEVLSKYASFADSYLADAIARGDRRPSGAVSALARAVHNLYAGVPGKSKVFRQVLETACQRVRKLQSAEQFPPFLELLHNAQAQIDSRVANVHDAHCSQEHNAMQHPIEASSPVHHSNS